MCFKIGVDLLISSYYNPFIETTENTMYDITCYPAIRTAGYSGFVIYGYATPSCGYWMVPGTFEHDWDNH